MRLYTTRRSSWVQINLILRIDTSVLIPMVRLGSWSAPSSDHNLSIHQFCLFLHPDCLLVILSLWGLGLRIIEGYFRFILTDRLRIPFSCSRHEDRLWPLSPKWEQRAWIDRRLNAFIGVDNITILLERFRSLRVFHLKVRLRVSDNHVSLGCIGW